jgi:hypothetical protein
MQRGYLRGITSPPALMLCLVASSAVVDLINVAIHEAPCVRRLLKHHRQHFMDQQLSIAVENSLYDVDHTAPTTDGIERSAAFTR